MSDVERIFHGVHDGIATWEIQQDIEPIIENNKQMQSEGTAATHEFGRVVASIPAVIVNKWIVEEGVPFLGMPEHEFRKWIAKKLMSSDFRYLRTR